uniref:Uncharacterized protein n=1 Tax=Opuntia streptacantha TaxID=393608 RepID=A0A7C9ERC8_OPUST
MLFSRIRLPLRTITSGVAPSVVTESTAADGVDNDEEDKEDDVDHSHPFPVGLEVLQHPGLARFTAEAEGIGVIAPFIAVWIRAICCWGGLDPHGWALVGKVATLWWFAATRLNRIQILGEELLGGNFVILNEILAEFTVHQTAVNPIPIPTVGDTFLKPVGVVPELVLLVSSITQGFAGSFVGDDEGEDGEAEEYDDEYEHDEEIEP